MAQVSQKMDRAFLQTPEFIQLEEMTILQTPIGCSRQGTSRLIRTLFSRETVFSQSCQKKKKKRDALKLKKAWLKLIDRHQILNTLNCTDYITKYVTKHITKPNYNILHIKSFRKVQVFANTRSCVLPHLKCLRKFLIKARQGNEWRISMQWNKKNRLATKAKSTLSSFRSLILFVYEKWQKTFWSKAGSLLSSSGFCNMWKRENERSILNYHPKLSSQVITKLSYPLILIPPTFSLFHL